MAKVGGKPVIVYWPLRGRAEVMRLALSLANQDWIEQTVDYAAMKSDKEAFPFGQAPAYKDGGLHILQSGTILRYIARKYDLEGKSDEELVINDMAMETVESLLGKYLTLIYQDQLSDAAKENFVKNHISKENIHGRNGGAHIDYLEWFLRKSGKPFITGDRCCIGDLAIWQLVDNLMRILEADIRPHYPLLMSHRERIADIPSIRQYLASPKRPAQVNGNKLG
mmetsp:Transcript_2796/g.6455  ORF Transcript_2796/g.6455 Transcript_2796/m.6455 type:complete len:224 (-) Transcript_2796:224-895(-)